MLVLWKRLRSGRITTRKETSVSAEDRTAARVLGHKPESVTFNGETWDIVCACSWECWNVEDEEVAWEAFNDHVFDDVRTAITRMRDRAKVTSLA